MSAVELYEAIVVDGAPDPALPGHIQVQIPELFDDEVIPILIPPMHPGWHAGGWHSVPSAVDPDGTDEVRVIVARVGLESYRWIGTSQKFPLITDAVAGTRAGARSGDGRHSVYLDNTGGAFITVGSDVDTTDNYFVIQPDNSIQAQTADGGFFRLSGPQAVVMNAAGDILMLDNTDGITLMHKDGVSFLSLKTGDVTTLAGTVVQVNGGTIELGGGVIPPLNAYILSLAHMADLSLAMADVVAIGAAIPTMMPFVATNAAAMIAKIATSLSAGAPYLSTRITGD